MFLEIKPENYEVQNSQLIALDHIISILPTVLLTSPEDKTIEKYVLSYLIDFSGKPQAVDEYFDTEEELNTRYDRIKAILDNQYLLMRS